MSFLPVFPLQLVAYPGEKLSLHIFEPRYRQLINECVEEGRPFGLPPYVDSKLPGYGTEMFVEDVVNRYDDGRMDIRTRGRRVFRMIDFENPVPGKLYAGATVEFLPRPEPAPVRPDLLEAVAELYRVFKTAVPFRPELPQPYSFQLGHAVGLSSEKEYELLTLETEEERQGFLLDHLEQVLPVVEQMERTRERIQMNGDFRQFGEIDLSGL